MCVCWRECERVACAAVRLERTVAWSNACVARERSASFAHVQLVIVVCVCARCALIPFDIDMSRRALQPLSSRRSPCTNYRLAALVPSVDVVVRLECDLYGDSRHLSEREYLLHLKRARKV